MQVDDIEELYVSVMKILKFMESCDGGESYQIAPDGRKIQFHDVSDFLQGLKAIGDYALDAWKYPR